VAGLSPNTPFARWRHATSAAPDVILQVAMLLATIFSERGLTFTFAIAVVCNVVRPTQAVQIFGNISTALSTLAIH